MRAGDVYRINRMIEDECTVEDIMARFKNDYDRAEIKKFIPKGTITAAEKEELDEAVDSENENVDAESAADMETRIRGEIEAENADAESAADMETRIRGEIEAENADAEKPDDKKTGGKKTGGKKSNTKPADPLA